MIRRFILASAVSLALLPGSSGALGLGGIRTESALNEPFVGEIELVDAVPDELDTVNVVLASPAEFEKVGAPRPHFLTQFSFRPQVSPQGRAVIQITSRDPIREPYLDFLVEVTWPKGRLVKEYTVLLDPPVTMNRPAPRVERPTMRQDPPMSPSAKSDVAQAQNVAPPARSSAGYPLRYGPVEPGEGLWRIARAMTPPDASLAQTAMALYRSNQVAFIGGDINKLALGAELVIPSSDELYALDRAAAEREFATALGGGRVTSTPLTDVTRPARTADRLEIASAAPSPETSATVPPREAGTAPPQELGVMRQELLLVQEMGESNRQETDELRARIRELETQLADIRKLLELRNEQLAQIQASMLETAGTAAEGSTDIEAEEIADAGGKPIAAEAPGSTVPKFAEDPPEPEQAALELTAEPDQSEPTAQVVKPASDAAQANPPAQVLPAEIALWKSIPLPVLGAAAGVPLLLAILGFMVVRRRRRLVDSVPAGGFDDELALPAEARSARETGTASGQPSEVGESAPPTFASAPLSDFSNLIDETDEGDILSEADVYIAYGRYREAELLLAKEIDAAPERMDLKLKLVEALVGAKNTERLQGLLGELREAGVEQKHPQQWQRLMTMARELMGPAGTDFGSTQPDASETSFPADSMSRSERWSETAKADSKSGVRSAPAGDAGSRRFDATQSSFPAPPSQDLALDLSDLGHVSSQVFLPEDKVANARGGSEPERGFDGLDDLESLRLDDLIEAQTRSSGSAADTLAPSGSELVSELTIDSLDIGPIAATAGTEAASSQLQLESGLWDEVATKIDLARAYMEMEDPDAARVILEEVVEEGSEDQQAEAREMLSRLR